MIAYTAAAFAVLQGVQPVFDGLLLPDFAFRVLVLLVLAGFPVTFALAWVYELTADGIRRTARVPGDEATPVARLPMRRWLQVAGIALIVAATAAGTAAGLGRLRFPSSAADGRVGLAIFPFRSAAGDPRWAEGAADLLATALDRTTGLRIVDPWPLWRPLRPGKDDAAAPPEPGDAERLTTQFDAHRFLLGSVIATGETVDVTLRLYQIGRADPIATFTVAGREDALADLVRDIAVRVLARVWGSRRPSNVPAELDFDATESPEALKAYIAAKDAMRHGWIDSANTAIDHAIRIDSAFVLAVVEAVSIKSWGFSTRGQPYANFAEMLDLAEAHAGEVNPRTQLRLEAVRASIRTEGARASAAARRILEIDPSDLDANSSLAYYERAYGWQFGVPFLAGGERAEALVRLDSTYMPSLAARAWWAIATADTADARRQLDRIAAADTVGVLGRAWYSALRAILASDAEFERSLPALAALPTAERVPTQMALRASLPARAEALYRTMSRSTDPFRTALGEAEVTRHEIARGRAASVDSAIQAGMFRANDLHRRLQLLIVAADLAGVGDGETARHVADELATWVLPDSALAWVNVRPVWWAGWMVGAWNAASGDTTLARRWIRALGALPAGDTTRDYRRSLQADIEARLAGRRGDFDSALRWSRAAFDDWGIHADNAYEAQPEPLMRFHRGVLFRQNNQPDSARAMFNSLVPPTTWAGVLTARASFELGDLDIERGDNAMAAFHYGRALRLWHDVGPGATVWLQRTQERLSAIASR